MAGIHGQGPRVRWIDAYARWRDGKLLWVRGHTRNTRPVRGQPAIDQMALGL